MKLRTGFVSNSSSSSFVIITTKENFERAINEVHPFIAAVAKEMFKEDKTFLGRTTMSANTFMSHGGDSNYDDMSIDYDGEMPEGYEKGDDVYYGEFFDKFCEKLLENNEEVIINENDW